MSALLRIFLSPAGVPPAVEGDRVSVIDLAENDARSDALARDFPAAYADFISALSRANASPDWWALSLAGRNPLSTDLPKRCFQLNRVTQAAKELGAGTLAVLTDDAVLARQIHAWAAGNGIPVAGALRPKLGWKERLNALLPSGPLFGFLRALWRLLRVRMLRRYQPEEGARYQVFATLLNHQSFDVHGRYRDTYFGDLPRIFKKNGLRPLVFGSVTHHVGPTLARSSVAGAADGVPILPMETYLSVAELWALLRKALGYRLRGFPFFGEARFQGLDVSLLVREELDANARASRLFDDLWYGACARSLIRTLPAEKVFFPFENRAWERMIALAYRELSPETELIGYQHAVLSPFHLNFILAEGEFDHAPLPDGVVAMGSVTLERMSGIGRFPPERLALGCALRQTPAPPPPAYRPARNLLVALASSVSEYERVLKLLEAAFRIPLSFAPAVRLRPHPVIPLEAALRRLGPLGFGYEKDDGELERSLAWADAVLFASGTLGLEAVRRGKPAVFLDVGDFLKTDPMEDFSALKWSARAPKDLHQALESIAALSAPQLASRQEKAADYVRRYCRMPDEAGLRPFLSSLQPDIQGSTQA